MPLVAYLKEGASKALGWHRNEERQVRGMALISDFSTELALESWERQLAVVEILLLGGGTPYANFEDLAHGWGLRKGFHSALINNVCERRGDIIRKRKSEIGVPVSPHKSTKQARDFQNAVQKFPNPITSANEQDENCMASNTKTHGTDTQDAKTPANNTHSNNDNDNTQGNNGHSHYNKDGHEQSHHQKEDPPSEQYDPKGYQVI
jgi:hypothetical protein